MEVYLFGGAVMSMVYDSRDSTEDMDVMLDKGYKEFMNICGDIARRHNLPHNWVNASVTAMVKDQFQKAEYLPMSMFSNLRLLVPSASMMLAMKLRAAREKDLDDCLRLLDELGLMPVTKKDLWEILNVYYKEGLLDNVIVRKKINRFMDLVVKRGGKAHKPLFPFFK